MVAACCKLINHKTSSDFFLNNTNLTFLYKIDIKGLKISKKKITSRGN